MPSLPDRGRSLWGAVVVVVGLLVIAGIFGATVWKFSNADNIVAIIGSVTGVVGTIVTAFFGIHATAAAGTDAATAAAYVNPEKAGELADKLRGVDRLPPPSPATAPPATPEQAGSGGRSSEQAGPGGGPSEQGGAGWPGGSPGPAPEIDRG